MPQPSWPDLAYGCMTTCFVVLPEPIQERSRHEVQADLRVRGSGRYE